MNTPYSQAMPDWIRSIITADISARYIPFILNVPTDNRSLENPSTRRRILTRLCEDATRVLHPTFSKSHPQRHPWRDSYGVVYLPAVKHDEVHLHGWLREPCHSVIEWVPAVISERRTTVTVLASTPTAFFIQMLAVRFQTSNIWVAHQGETILSEDEQDFGGLEYLNRRKSSEIREWDSSELVPIRVFKGTAADRQLPPTTLRLIDSQRLTREPHLWEVSQ